MPARIVHVLVQIAKAAMLAAFVTMIALTLVQVVNRYAIGFTLFWTEELIVLLLVWSVLLGLPVQLWLREEIVVDILPLSDPAMQRAKLLLGGALAILFCGILAVSGYSYAMRGLTVSSPALGLSRFWFFVPIPLSAALSILVLLTRPRREAHEAFEA
jgi:TRAP-type C4-dicarboxylate transport system permease small subunit